MHYQQKKVVKKYFTSKWVEQKAHDFYEIIKNSLKLDVATNEKFFFDNRAYQNDATPIKVAMVACKSLSQAWVRLILTLSYY